MNKGVLSGWHRLPGWVPWEYTLGGVQMSQAQLNSAGQIIQTQDQQGSGYLVKKQSTDAGVLSHDSDVLYADFFALLPVAGQNILATDSNLIAYSHFLPLGSDIPASIQPVLAVNANAGTGATINYQAGYYSGDSSGTIHIRSGTAATASGTIFTLTYGSAYNPNIPVPIVQQFGSTALGVFVVNSTPTVLTVGVTTAMTINTDYFFYYLTLGI